MKILEIREKISTEARRRLSVASSIMESNLDTKAAALRVMRVAVQEQRAAMVAAGVSDYQTSVKVADLTRADQTLGVESHSNYVRHLNAAQTWTTLSPRFQPSMIEAMNAHDQTLAPTKGAKS